MNGRGSDRGVAVWGPWDATVGWGNFVSLVAAVVRSAAAPNVRKRSIDGVDCDWDGSLEEGGGLWFWMFAITLFQVAGACGPCGVGYLVLWLALLVLQTPTRRECSSRQVGTNFPLPVGQGDEKECCV